MAQPLDSWKSDEHAFLIADGIARFRDPADAERSAAPSLAVIAGTRPVSPLPLTFRARPMFGSAEDTTGVRRIVRVSIETGTSLYGTGEIAGSLLRNGARTVCWTTDSFEYDQTNQTLYQAHPWVLAVRADGSSFGVLADTTCKCEIDLTTDIRFSVEDKAPPFAVYVIERDTPQQVVAALADLTGEMPMPPRWALGYQQSRWSYEPASRVVSWRKSSGSVGCRAMSSGWTSTTWMGFGASHLTRSSFLTLRA